MVLIFFKKNTHNFSVERFLLLITRANHFLVVSYVTLTVPRTSTVCGQKNESVKGQRSSFNIRGDEIGQRLPSKGHDLCLSRRPSTVFN